MSWREKLIHKLQKGAAKQEGKMLEHAHALAEKYERMVREDRAAEAEQAKAYAEAIAHEERLLKQEVLKSEAEVDRLGWELDILRYGYKGNIRKERKVLKAAYKKQRRVLLDQRRDALKALHKAKQAYRHEHGLVFRAGRKVKAASAATWKWVKTGGLVGYLWRKHKAKAKDQPVIVIDTTLPEAA